MYKQIFNRLKQKGNNISYLLTSTRHFNTSQEVPKITNKDSIKRHTIIEQVEAFQKHTSRTATPA